MRVLILLSLSFALIACEAPATRVDRIAANSARADSLSRWREDSANRARPDYVIDSILPAAEALRRFRAKIGGDSARALTRGGESIAALIQRFAGALSQSDTAALRTMALTAREFADLYYLESPYSRPPYRQPPELAWQLLQQPSTEGIGRLMKELGGKPVSVLSHVCDPKVARDGNTTRHGPCLVRLRDASGERPPQRYFGSILERDGQFKFLSYANRN